MDLKQEKINNFYSKPFGQTIKNQVVQIKNELDELFKNEISFVITAMPVFHYVILDEQAFHQFIQTSYDIWEQPFIKLNLYLDQENIRKYQREYYNEALTRIVNNQREEIPPIFDSFLKDNPQYKTHEIFTITPEQIESKNIIVKTSFDVEWTIKLHAIELEELLHLIYAPGHIKEWSIFHDSKRSPRIVKWNGDYTEQQKEFLSRITHESIEYTCRELLYISPKHKEFLMIVFRIRRLKNEVQLHTQRKIW